MESAHRKPGHINFLDPDERGVIALKYFKFIRDFVLDPMHLIDGGVLKDFLLLICKRLEALTPEIHHLKSLISTKLKAWIKLFNKNKILEICKFR